MAVFRDKVPKIDGLRIDEAHKGGIVGALLSPATALTDSLLKAGKKAITPKIPGASATELAAAAAQDKELKDLQAKEDARLAAMTRRKGRSSLLSGAETGMKETLGA